MRGARRSFAVLAAVFVGAALAAGAGCSTSSSTPAGLEVVVATDLKTPDDFDRFELDVRQETSPGTYAPLFEKDFLLPQEATLPTTFGVGSGTAADQNALVRVTAKKGAAAIILREALVQVPHDRVATLTMVLAAACRGQVATAAGLAQSTCANPLVESCQPSTGRCGTTSLDAASLPTYSPGDESLVDAGPIGVSDGAPGDVAVPPDANSPDATVEGGAPPADAATDATDTSDATDRSDAADMSDAACAAGSIRCPGGCVRASDPSNCGACGHTCIGGTCSAGVCQPWVIATLAGSTSVQLAVDGTYAAFGASPHGVQVIPVAGAAGGFTPRTLTSTFASAVTLAGGKVVWAINDSSSSSTTLSFAPAASGAATTTPALGFARGGVFSLGVNAAGTQVYLLDNGSNATTVNVYACTPVSASASCSQVGSFTIPSAPLFPPTPTAYSFLGTNQFLYYGGSSALGRFGLTSGAKSSVTGQGPTLQSVAVDTTSVYWLNSGNNASTTTLSVGSAPLGLGSSKTLVSGISAGLYFGAFAGEIAVDTLNVYLAVLNGAATTAGGMYLASVPKTGGALSAPLYATPYLINGLTAVNGALYWAEIVASDVNPVATIYGLRLP